MTFKVGDRVRLKYKHLGVVTREPEDEEVQIKFDGADVRYWDIDDIELVSPAPTESIDKDNIIETLRGEREWLRERLKAETDYSVRLAVKLDEFKAKVVEVLKDRLYGSYNAHNAILEDLGLAPKPSRYRVSFEVEAKSAKEAPLVAWDQWNRELFCAEATVDRIEDDS